MAFFNTAHVFNVSRRSTNLLHYFRKTLHPNLADIFSKSCSCNLEQKRFYKPYSRTPKKYLKQKNRDKKDRDDVYFITDQTDPVFSVEEAINIKLIKYRIKSKLCEVEIQNNKN